MSAWRTTPISSCAGSDGAGPAGVRAARVPACPRLPPYVPQPAGTPPRRQGAPEALPRRKGSGGGPSRRRRRRGHSNVADAMAAAEPLSPAEAEALVRALRGTELRDAGGKGCGERVRLRGGHTGPGRGEGCGGINSRCPPLRR